MKKIVEQHSVESTNKITKVLLELGFDLQLIGSQLYVESKLESLNKEEILELKAAFIGSPHPRLKKEVISSRHNPFGKTTDYVLHIQTADNVKIGKLIKILAMLSQTKVYLFWKNE